MPAESRLSPTPPPALGKAHTRRLREVYRSAGWPSQDMVEIDLLAAGLIERVRSAAGHESLRLTDSGVRQLALALAVNRQAMSAHEHLVEQVARELCRGGRIVWRGLSLRARVPATDDAQALRWGIARPDLFSIRNTSVQAYAQPIVHEIKVRRADLLGDLQRSGKRAAYLDLGQCWYVLGCDAKGRCIGSPQEVPVECGVMVVEGERLQVARAAPKHARPVLPFDLWMALAKATPVAGFDDDSQGLLGCL